MTDRLCSKLLGKKRFDKENSNLSLCAKQKINIKKVQEDRKEKREKNKSVFKTLQELVTFPKHPFPFSLTGGSLELISLSRGNMGPVLPALNPESTHPPSRKKDNKHKLK